jgi:hypothetical protein
MVNWIIILVIVFAGYFILKLGNLKHRFFIILFLLITLFLYLTMVYVNRQNNLDFTSADGVFKSLKIYQGWLANGFHNLITLGGYATKLDWTATNGSIIKTNPLENKQNNKQASVTLAK